MLQASALQVRLELLVDIPGQSLTLRRNQPKLTTAEWLTLVRGLHWKRKLIASYLRFC